MDFGMLSIMRGGWFDVFVDVEWDVTGFGVGHILSIRQVESDIEEVYGFLLASMTKWYYDENCIFPMAAIITDKQVACARRKKLFTLFKYLFSFQRYSSF